MLLIQKTTLILFWVFMAQFGFSQQKEPKNMTLQHELGLNVTNLLTDLLGNNNRTDAGVYLLSYKKVKSNRALRIGATINFSVKNQNNLNVSSSLTNQNFQLRIGRETRQNLSTKFQYYYGLDFIGGFQQEQSSATAGSGQIIQTDKVFTIGGGPVLGFQFAIYDRLLIGTEGSLYAAYNKSSVDFKAFTTGSVVFPNKKSEGMNIQTNLPKFLFLIVKF